MADLRQWSAIVVKPFELSFPDRIARALELSSTGMTLDLPIGIVSDEELPPPPSDYILNIVKMMEDIRERKRTDTVREFHAIMQKLRFAKAFNNSKETDYLKRRLAEIENDLRRLWLADK